MATETLTIPALLDHLRATPAPGGRVLSVYLDTSPGRLAGQAYRMALQDGCDAVRATLDPAERERFEAAAARAVAYVTDAFVPQGRGLALFTAPEPEYLYAVGLPKPPVDTVAWAETPRLEPLQELVDDAERYAVLLFDKERTRLFTVFLGQVEEQRAFADAVPGKQETGGWFALAQSRYARHHEDHVLRHAKRTIRALLNLLQRRPFDRLLVSGPDEAVSVLIHHLPRPLRARLAGTLSLPLYASDAEVLAATLPVAEAIERQVERALVDDLLAGAATPHVALGYEQTLAAISEGRVHQLVLADEFAGIGSECPACGRLIAGVGVCPACGEMTRPVSDLRERLLARALDQGAKIEIVSGEAAALLMVYNGLGARTRY
jgi:peptide subunit release factor 1 (eRF1)